MAEFKTHAIINNEFINIYNDENPIMEAGEECFAERNPQMLPW